MPDVLFVDGVEDDLLEGEGGFDQAGVAHLLIPLVLASAKNATEVVITNITNYVT